MRGKFRLMKGFLFRTQKGVIRTNCLDCLDRTNSVQALIGGRVSNCCFFYVVEQHD